VSINRDLCFRILAIGAVLAAGYHAAGLAGLLANSQAPAWRHALFIAIDLVLAWYLLRRPLWMFPLFVLLFIQQAVSHGRHAIDLYRSRHVIDYISLVDLAALSIGLVLLTLDARNRLRNRPTHNALAG
jgi:uncharacterized membrane protein